MALLALANILYKSGHVDDALIVTDMALEAAPHLVVLHFTMANLYASKVKSPSILDFISVCNSSLMGVFIYCRVNGTEQ